MTVRAAWLWVLAGCGWAWYLLALALTRVVA